MALRPHLRTGGVQRTRSYTEMCALLAAVNVYPIPTAPSLPEPESPTEPVKKNETAGS
jgi:hypothetical protein